MNRMMQIIGASALALTMTGASLAPAAAAPFFRGGGHGWHGGGWHGGGWDRGWGAGSAIAGGVLLGGLLGSALSSDYASPYGYYPRRAYYPQRVVYVDNAHVNWCSDHYRSYRASDNTFQPNNGPRQQCIAPFDR